MSAEDQVEKRIEEYAEIAKKNKNVNVAALMIGALEQAQREEMDAKKKSRAYFISTVIPPSGLFIAGYYYFFSDKPDAKEVARNCLILTGVVTIITLLIGKLMLASVPNGATSQLQNLNVTDLIQQQKALTQ